MADFEPFQIGGKRFNLANVTHVVRVDNGKVRVYFSGRS